MKDLKQFLNGVSVMPEGELLTHEGLFDRDGVLQPMPASWWAEKSRPEKMLFGHNYGLYGFPTVELVADINRMINGREALEIGSGNGGLALALGIRATDNYQQDMPKYKKLYELTGQPGVQYGPHVERIDALKAVCTYDPKVVVASWVTHKFDPTRPHLNGNEIGVEEQVMLGLIDEYIFIGNTNIHNTKPLFLDLHEGRIRTHEVKEFYVDQRAFASRASGGFDFLIRIGRV